MYMYMHWFCIKYFVLSYSIDIVSTPSDYVYMYVAIGMHVYIHMFVIDDVHTYI